MGSAAADLALQPQLERQYEAGDASPASKGSPLPSSLPFSQSSEDKPEKQESEASTLTDDELRESKYLSGRE